MKVRYDREGVVRIASAIARADGYPDPWKLVRDHWWGRKEPAIYAYIPQAIAIIAAVAELERAELEP